jgi:hypothetical protein
VEQVCTFLFQVDGRCESANKSILGILGILELLVIKRIVRVIIYSRLPLTHEDIDVVFGIISVNIRDKQLIYLEQFNEAVTQALGAQFSKLNIQIEDVYVVSDYTNGLRNA